MKTLSHWLLGGALAASLSFNWTLYQRAAVPADCAASASCALDGIALEPAQRAAVDGLCQRSCRAADELERRANERQRELLASLSRASVDPVATHALVDEVSELRRQSLATCVEGILGLRAVLDGEQVRALLERCEQTKCK
ncbi:MAG: periplasmic heavy metal sensor [Planctomycetes bacterium]|nr:periplasmic heavy metal sensor [Planctomycetota bacterium]